MRAPVDDVPSPDGAASLRSSQALLRATVAPDGVHRMREDAELAARLETSPETSWYADAQVALGVARWLSGSAQRALHPLAVAAREGSVHNPSAELAALGYLALIGTDEGEWDTAAGVRGARDRAPGRARVRHHPPLPAHAAGASDAAGAAVGAEAAEAAADVERLLEHMVPHPWMVLLAHVVLGEVAIEGGDVAAAEAHAATAPPSSSATPTRASCGAAPSTCARSWNAAA